MRPTKEERRILKVRNEEFEEALPLVCEKCKSETFRAFLDETQNVLVLLCSECRTPKAFILTHIGLNPEIIMPEEE